jgi:hypothetical protein
MRLVKNMDDRFYKELVLELEQGFYDLSHKYNHFSVDPVPRPTAIQTGDQEFPFPLADEIYQIHQYLVGQSIAMPEFMYDSLQGICELVWHNPFLNRNSYDIQWEAWEKTKLGFFVRCSFIAIALEAGDTVNSKQLSLMTGISATAVIKQIREGKLRAEKQDREWVIEAEEALAFIQTQLEGTRA